jgi:hypothetical protein
VIRFLMGLFTWIMLCVFPPMRTFISQGVGYLVCVMNAKARGSVSITSKDPRAPLDIGTNMSQSRKDQICQCRN